MRKIIGTTNKSAKFKESRKSSLYFAFFLGAVIIGAAIVLGRSRIYIVFVPLFALIITWFWRKQDRAWISVASMSAASPIPVTRFGVNSNLLFVLWSLFFNMRSLSQLPKWLYLPSGLIILGLITSSINWLSKGMVSGLSREVIFVFNMFIGPLLLLPAIYLRMKNSQDKNANLQGLLFFLILPSTFVLLAAKLFGHVSNSYTAYVLHANAHPEGFLMYRLGNAYINFLRTEVGFLLACLICASAAIAISKVKGSYKIVATGCLAINVFLLLSTASFGSIASCLLGLAAIFFIQAQKVNLGKVFTSIFIICLTLVVAYVFAPQSTKEYLSKRYEYRVVNRDADRVTLWKYGFEELVKHPEGVGFTLKGSKGGFIHNDYISFMVSYGFLGGLGYPVLICGLFFSFLKMRKKISKDPPTLAVFMAGFGVLVALAFNGITDHSNENRWYLNAMWSMIWYCYFCSYPVRTAPTHQDTPSEALKLEHPSLDSPKPKRRLGLGVKG